MEKHQSSVAIEKQAYITAITAAISAGKHILKYWPNPLNHQFDKSLVMEIFEKAEGTGNYATIADKESEKIIKAAILKQPLLKTHRIIGEETEEIVTDSEYQWAIDPIDGTLNFKNGIPLFGVSIGVLKNNVPIIGVLAFPALEHQPLLVAQKGKGAKIINFEKKQLMDLTNRRYEPQPLDKTLISYDLGYENRVEQIKNITIPLADKVAYIPAYASSAYANYLVALGHVGAYLHETPTLFDIAGAGVIIPEIGGAITDLEGKPIDWSADSRTYLAATTPQIHRQLLEIINQ